MLYSISSTRLECSYRNIYLKRSRVQLSSACYQQRPGNVYCFCFLKGERRLDISSKVRRVSKPGNQEELSTTASSSSQSTLRWRTILKADSSTNWPFFNSPFASQSNSAHIPVSERGHFKVKFGFSVTCALLWVDTSCKITDHIRVVKCIRFLFFFPSFAIKKDLQFERVDSIVKCKTNFSIDLLQFWPILILSIRELEKIKKEMYFKVIVYRDAKWHKNNGKWNLVYKRSVTLHGVVIGQSQIIWPTSGAFLRIVAS